jgi:hypothetical protein
MVRPVTCQAFVLWGGGGIEGSMVFVGIVAPLHHYTLLRDLIVLCSLYFARGYTNTTSVFCIS